MKQLSFSFFLIFYASSISHAQDYYIGYGIGMSNCGDYLQARKTPNSYYESRMKDWFYGFASGRNTYKAPQISREINGNAVLAYFDKGCREAPLASVSWVAIQLISVYEK